MEVREGVVREQPVEQLHMVDGGRHKASQPRVRPNERDVGVSPKDLTQGLEVDGFAGARRQHRIDVVVQNDREADLTREIEQAIQRRIVQTRSVARDLGGHELLVDRELTDAGEHPRVGLQHPADVVRGVHVGGIEARDHGIEARLLHRRQRPVLLGNDRVDEGVVVQRRVRVQVVVGRPLTRLEVVPLLLQRDAEHRRSPGVIPGQFKELAQRDPPLDVVRQVEVDVVERRPLPLRLLRPNRENGGPGEGQYGYSGNRHLQ